MTDETTSQNGELELDESFEEQKRKVDEWAHEQQQEREENRDRSA